MQYYMPMVDVTGAVAMRQCQSRLSAAANRRDMQMLTRHFHFIGMCCAIILSTTTYQIHAAEKPIFDAHAISRTLQILEREFDIPLENKPLKDVLGSVAKTAGVTFQIEDDTADLPAKYSGKGKLGDVLTALVHDCDCEMTITGGGELHIHKLPLESKTEEPPVIVTAPDSKPTRPVALIDILVRESVVAFKVNKTCNNYEIVLLSAEVERESREYYSARSHNRAKNKKLRELLKSAEEQFENDTASEVDRNIIPRLKQQIAETTSPTDPFSVGEVTRRGKDFIGIRELGLPTELLVPLDRILHVIVARAE